MIEYRTTGKIQIITVAQRRVRFILTGNFGTAPIAVLRLANSPMELAHMLYEALSIRDEFAKI